MDLLDDLLDGSPPWEYNDNVDMVDSSAEGAGNVTEGASPKESIAFPPHWGELMEQIRVREEEMKRVMLSRRSGESVSPAPDSASLARPAASQSMPSLRPPGMLPVSAYSLLPTGAPTDVAAAFQPPYVPYPHMPFWTAAPLPFSPNVYPVNVLPPKARESLLAPRAPPRPAAETTTKKKKQPRLRGRGRPRDAKGLFLKSPEEEADSAEPVASDDATNVLLMGRIQELQKALQQSRYESVVLREQLVHSQMELSQLKDRGLVKANLKGMEGGGSWQPTAPIPTPAAAAPAFAGSSVKASSPPQPSAMMDAFRVQLDYAQIKSKLRPTNNGHYDAESTDLEQQQQMQQQQSPRHQPHPQPLGLNWELE